MRICPLCQSRYDDDVRRCSYDGRRPLPEAVLAAAPGDILLGATLADRYTIIGRLGAGGMGTVYRAEQAPIGREVALKVLRKDLGRDPETVARFHREAHTLSALKHPNTVTIFDFGQTTDGLLYLAMELLEGEMLSSRLKREGPLDVRLAIRIAEGVLRSLAEAHERGIIHRDLKPDNIFLAKVHGRPHEDEVVKVVDFGIAKIRDGARNLEPLETQEGTVFGTPRYMSPEQAQGKTLDGRSDLYAVGVLLFHMLTGQAPFTDDDAVVVMAHHIKTVPAPVRSVAPARPIPASLEALVRRALEKDPVERPQNAETFLAELERTADDARRLAAASLSPPTLAPPSPASRQPSRRVVVTAVIVAVLLALGAGLASATLRRSRPTGATAVAQTDGAGARTGATTAPPVPAASTPAQIEQADASSVATAAEASADAGVHAANSGDAGRGGASASPALAAVDPTTVRTGAALGVAESATSDAATNASAGTARGRPPVRRGARGTNGHREPSPYHRWDNN